MSAKTPIKLHRQSSTLLKAAQIRRAKRGLSKRLLVLLSIGLVLLSAIPAASGLVVEKIIRAAIENFNRNSPVQVSVQYYRHGWLTSKALSQLHIPNTNWLLNLSHRIDHLPLSIDAWRSGHLSLSLARIISRPVNHGGDFAWISDGNLQLVSLLRFDGDIVNQLTSVPRLLTSHIDITGLAWREQTIVGEALWREKFATLGSWLRFDRAQFGNNQSITALKDAHLHTNYRAGRHSTNADMYLELGSIDYSIPDLRLSSTQSWLRMDADAGTENTTLRVQGAAAQFHWNGIVVDDMVFDLALKIPVHDHWRPSEKLLHYLPPATELELVHLSLTHKDRQLETWARLTTNPALGDHSAPPADIATLFNRLTIDAELVADRSLVFEILESRVRDVINRTEEFGAMTTFSDAEAAPLVRNSVESQLAILERQRYLDRYHDRFAARVSLRDGRVAINDKPLALSGFMR